VTPTELGLQTAAPSSAAKTRMIAQQQDKFPLYNGRPPEKYGFRLFHPAFENFHRRYHGCENKSAVLELLGYSADYYDNGDARQDAVTLILGPLLRCGLGNKRDTDKTDVGGGILYSTANARTHEVTALLFFELNEIGAGDSNATLQVGLIYRKHWSRHMVFHLFCSSAVVQYQWLSGQKPCRLLPCVSVGHRGSMGMRTWCSFRG